MTQLYQFIIQNNALLLRSAYLIFFTTQCYNIYFVFDCWGIFQKSLS